ncbi:Wzz/FepE/Etk N-terminal domain-containing protein [Providencia hangzhouensis]
MKIGFFTVIFAAIAIAYSLLATPIYQANATLQYDKLGQVSLLDQMSDVYAIWKQ